MDIKHTRFVKINQHNFQMIHIDNWCLIRTTERLILNKSMMKDKIIHTYIHTYMHALPYDQQAFSPLDLTASWLSHLSLAIYMFVVVNFDALVQASDIRIERRQVVFLCWMQDSNPHTHIHTYIHTCLLLLISMLWHRQAIFESKGDKLSSSAECRIRTHIHTYIHTYMFVVVNFDALAQANDIRIERRQVVFLCWMQDSNPHTHIHTYIHVCCC